MNILNHPDACSGCGGCTAICPTDAITLKLNHAGFFEAAVEENRCVDCNLCTQICPRFSKNSGIDLNSLSPLALQSCSKKTVRRSASGGTAHELAAAALEQGRKAVGAVYDCKSDQVAHKVISQACELDQLSGSKYLQSNTEDAFRQVLATAAAEKYIVFGTPCQVNGLAAALEQKKLRQNVLLVEIFCHGVPSYRLWQAQLSQVRKKLGKDPFTSVRFRDKRYGWHSYCLQFENENGAYEAKREQSLFWQVFFEDILLNDACYQCSARLSQTVADIRIGDYWGSHFQARTDGVSLVFAATEAGKQAIKALMAAEKLSELSGTNSAEALKYQNMSHYRDDPLHTAAMRALEQGQSVKAVIRTYRRKLPVQKKLKRYALIASGYLPQGLKRKLRQLRLGK